MQFPDDNNSNNNPPPDPGSTRGEPLERRPDRNRGEGRVVVHGIVVHPPQAEPSALGRDFGAPLRVLIADDYVDAAESLAMLLSQSGVETQVAVEGQQALFRASNWHPHVCVLDIEMPGLDGCEIARQIRSQRWAERPLLIALTGWTTARDRSSALEAGFDHYLTKPVEPAKLVRIIQNYLGGRLI